MSPTEAEHKEFIRRFVQEVFNGKNLDQVGDYVAEDYIGHNPAQPEPIQGPEGYRAFVAMLQEGFPDFEVQIQDLLAEGPHVAQRSVQTGTHEGPFMDIPPTGQSAEVSGLVIYEIREGQITEEWVQADMAGLMEQLGVTER